VTRILINNHVETPRSPHTSDALTLHRRLPGYSPTPLVRADTIAKHLGVGSLWVKDESHRIGLPSFKIMGASWATYKAIEERLGDLGEWNDVEDLKARLSNHRPLALAAATDGNHGRAVARMASMLGLQARIFVPAGTSPARIEAIESEGASCIVVEGSYDDAVGRSAQEASDSCLVISDTSWPGYERVPQWVIEGYSTIFTEVDDQLEGDAPDVVVIQVGVGALGAAAVQHFRARDKTPCRLVAVEPDSAACLLASVEAGRLVTVPGPHQSMMAGLNCGTPSLVAWPFTSRGFDCYVAIGDSAAAEGMRLLADEGIIAGETGAAGLGALIELLAASSTGDAVSRLELDHETSVLLISTEGATDPESYERIVGRPPSS
jgi:diaminopropionate ammonia-lyase